MKACVFKEKLKLLKEKLKMWNKGVFGAVDLNLESFVEELNELDVKACEGEVGGMESRRFEVEESFWKELTRKESLQGRRRKNQIVSIQKNGYNLETVEDIKGEILSSEDIEINASDSLWWKDILLSGFVSEGETNWFSGLLKWRIGDGKLVLFWKDIWMDHSTLKSRYFNLFSLSQDKEGKISDMGEWTNNAWSWNLHWTRTLKAEEADQAADLESCISAVTLQSVSRDSICWTPQAVPRIIAERSPEQNQGLWMASSSRKNAYKDKPLE
ncbi:hypothetical protein TSUD_244790 [Trifolium subterraneum]|uniref:Reverse transcriptase zinc-binding domain-containing protein n=1 Tax=Trifolium subterraneum TaxID=3900 RepID=A0A2Z6N9I0_TRISU|nr:hypothetical protein TSUD_244790 [Trifolium subterraneum]